MRAFVLAAVVYGFTRAASAQEAASPTDRAFRSFWTAPHASAAAERIEPILKTGVSFGDALSRVRHGRDYERDVPRGLQFGRHRTFDGMDHDYAFVIPKDYDPSRSYQVRFQLHGGIARARPPMVNRIRVDALPSGIEEITVYPAGWVRSLWWSATQVDNLARILDRLKRTYNIDENRVYLTGISDGGTGVYYIAFRDPTPWASFLPLLGNMLVLGTTSVRAEGEIYPGNAVNKPFYVVNTGRDRLYPAHVIEMYVDHLRKVGAQVVYRVYPELEHSTEWWTNERPELEAFVEDHPREPLPDSISWQTERVDRFNRAHWLIIDRLGAVDGERHLPDSNMLRRGRELDFGLRINSGIDRGRRAQEVVARSNAFNVGLRAGDRFVEVNGQPVEGAVDIAREMARWTAGDPMRLVVERKGDRVVIEGIYNPTEVELPPTPIFPHRKPSGRVDLVRRGNVVEASTEGVRAFTLLLSPSIFDFRRPITVTVNGRTAFEGLVEPSVETLLKWAARDNDRTMVFGAELNIELAK
ncbi:MAG TPA: PDZ domain-containing protein [Vicinamibacterales bacterium]|nr:PDZ domain-containing protein [Vicinamibacterales bacterium]